MNIHILGICGTFMGSVAVLAKELGHTVSGSDANVYPPMSTQLEAQGIDLMDGYQASHLKNNYDVIVVGNTVSRGNPAVEYMLDARIPYQSGPQWLSQNLLGARHVLAVSGTHGKTTTSSMLAWILEAAEKKPGFLIGGVAENFGVSARCGGSEYFVVEADEYDTAFFDKRSKFIHYQPQTLIINNIEFDHADIFDSLADIRRQFHHLVRIVPASGLIVRHGDDKEIDTVLEKGCWSTLTSFAAENAEWSVIPLAEDYSEFEVVFENSSKARVVWNLIGRHNAENAIAAIAAAANVGVSIEQACVALGEFRSVKRRLQVLGLESGVTLYDDFAHHPTAISATLSALRAKTGSDSRIIAVLEPRSNTMKMGVHRDALAGSLDIADEVFLFEPPGLAWDLRNSMSDSTTDFDIFNDIDQLVASLIKQSRDGDHVVVMSNGGFHGVHGKILDELAKR
ncbi:MAG: UDP-N-acetylmuramate:L-alanyl-gamma-D-glutamyl-meso-diaminopimelate ligase [Gammaproteobacteria bacterium]|nr:UDP-N-acetylmuramate:L-alanyl-gamma-D-glutamyl-meso-diaminopimelate ligase [Gammaproteobacteria bacterium]